MGPVKSPKKRGFSPIFPLSLRTAPPLTIPHVVPRGSVKNLGGEGRRVWGGRGGGLGGRARGGRSFLVICVRTLHTVATGAEQ
jgi:hypothetical protein